MKIQKIDSQDEKRLLIAMIVDKTVLGRIASKWPKMGGLFRSKFSNTIAKWCLDFDKKFGRAPGKTIKSIFEQHAQKLDDNTSSTIESLLQSLNNQYKQLKKESQSDVLIDLAAQHFDRVEKERLISKLQSALDASDLDKANALITSHHPIEMGLGSTVDVFQDMEAWQEAFEHRRESLITYPGALGEFFGANLEREGFVALFAPYKRGKSAWLMDLVIRAVSQRLRTAYFQAGDMSQRQVMFRLGARISGRPIRPGIVKIPTSLTRNSDGEIEVEFREKEFKKHLSWQKAWAAVEKFVKSKIRSKQSYLKLSCHAKGTLSSSIMMDKLREWERENWVPDIFVVDYPDIMDMSKEEGDLRDKISSLWIKLGGISQSRHCLVVVVTQIKASGLKSESINESHFADDSRKMGHVTALYALNQTREEKEQGLYRIGSIYVREEEFSQSKQVTVASCLGLGNICVLSSW